MNTDPPGAGTLDDVAAFLRRQRYGVVASLDADGAPQAAVVGLAFADDGSAVFDTLDATRKARNLGRDPRAALVVWEGERTVQLDGVVEAPAGPDLARARDAYLAVFPDGAERLGWDGIAHLRFRPTWLRATDFAARPGPAVVEPLGPPAPRPAPAVVHTRAVIARYVAAYASGDTTTLDEIIAPDFVDHGAPEFGRGPAGVRRAIEAFHAGFSAVACTLEHCVCEGDTAAFRFAMAATHTGVFAGCAPTGRRVAWTGGDFVRLRDGRLEALWSVQDTLALLRGIGAVPMG